MKQHSQDENRTIAKTYKTNHIHSTFGNLNTFWSKTKQKKPANTSTPLQTITYTINKTHPSQRGIIASKQHKWGKLRRDKRYLFRTANWKRGEQRAAATSTPDGNTNAKSRKEVEESISSSEKRSNSWRTRTVLRQRTEHKNSSKLPNPEFLPSQKSNSKIWPFFVFKDSYLRNEQKEIESDFSSHKIFQPSKI